jgi:16S rRNA processing protein RimM
VHAAWHTIGEVRSVNPARRELRISAWTAAAARCWMAGTGFGCNAAARSRCGTRAKSIRKTGDDVVAALADGVPRDEVRTLNGARVVTDEAFAPTANEFAVDDLIGLNVFERGALLGRVVDAMETPAHDVVEIEREDGSRAMVPLAAELVAAVDFGAGRIDMHDAPSVESAPAG